VSIEPDTVYLASARVRVEGGGAPSTAAYTASSDVYFYDANHVQITWPSGLYGGADYQRVISWSSTRRNPVYMRFERPMRTPPNAAFAMVRHFVYVPSSANLAPVTAVYFDDVHFEESEKLPAMMGFGLAADEPIGTEHALGYGSYGEIAVDPVDPNVLYAMNDNASGVSSAESGDFIGVWKSANGGATWRLTTRLLPSATSNVFDPKTSASSKFGGYLLAIGSGAAGRLHLYAGTGLQLYKTSDGGATWAAATYDLDRIRTEQRRPTIPATTRRVGPTTSSRTSSSPIRISRSASTTETPTATCR
jgi:hypothetical protein